MVVGILLTSLLLYSVECDWFSNCERLSSTCTTSKSVNTPEYRQLSAADKKTKIMENVMADTRSADWFNPLQMSGILTERMCPTFR